MTKTKRTNKMCIDNNFKRDHFAYFFIKPMLLVLIRIASVK